jgi:hypothetical protein
MVDKVKREFIVESNLRQKPAQQPKLSINYLSGVTPNPIIGLKN